MADRARQAYQTNQVQMEDRIGLVIRLYDGLLSFLRRGAEALAAGKRAEAADPVRRAADIIGELQAVLNLRAGGEVAFNLDRIYSYCRRRLMESHLQSNPDGLNEIVRLLTPLRDAWVEARVKHLAAGGQ
jgi:flagellar secretion chaperone FliS